MHRLIVSAPIVLALGCTSTPLQGHEGQPGFKLPEGGALFHDHVTLLGMPAQTWFSLYQYTSPVVDSAPFPVPALGGKGMYGNCVDERTTLTWPFAPLTQATFFQLSNPTLTGPGFVGTVPLVENQRSRYPQSVVSWTGRIVDIAYGPVGSVTPTNGFAANQLDGRYSVPDSDYTVDIGEGKPMTYHTPQGYTPPLGIGGSATVTIAAGGPLEFTWAPPTQMEQGAEYVPATHFNFTMFADPTSQTPLQFICFPDVDGHQVIPAAVIDALPSGGLVANANYTQYMQARTQPDGKQRRFDLEASNFNVSLYKIQ